MIALTEEPHPVRQLWSCLYTHTEKKDTFPRKEKKKQVYDTSGFVSMVPIVYFFQEAASSC